MLVLTRVSPEANQMRLVTGLQGYLNYLPGLVDEDSVLE
jgi:hypothetical protein